MQESKISVVKVPAHVLLYTRNKRWCLLNWWNHADEIPSNAQQMWHLTEERGDMSRVQGKHGLKDPGSHVSAAQQHLTTSPQSRRLPYWEQLCDPSTDKGATVTKEGEGKECMGEQKNKENKNKKQNVRKERQYDRKNTTGRKKYNNNWPTSCLKVGRVLMTPLPDRKMWRKKRKALYSGFQGLLWASVIAHLQNL